MCRQLLVVALSSLVFFTPSPAAADYVITTVDVPDATATTAYAINDRGQIVGEFTDGGGKSHGFLRSNGQFTPIDVPGATRTSARGINNTGQIVGNYTDNAGRPHGFLLVGSRFTTLDPPTSVNTTVSGINDLGQIVGRFQDASTTNLDFLYSHGQFLTLTPIGYPNAQLQGINNLGQIVGNYTPFGGSITGFRLMARGGVTTFSVPQSSFTIPFAINNLGEVVGEDNGDLGRLRAFLLAYGTYTVIQFAGAETTRTLGINNRHQIVGEYSVRPNESTLLWHGYVMTPSNESEDLSGSASSDGSRVPPDPAVFDNDLTPWTLGPGQEILRNGVQAAGGYGSQILWYHGSIYVLGDDGNWWRWTGGSWAFAGPNDPGL